MPYRWNAAVSAALKTSLTADFAAATGWTAQSGVNRAKWLDNKIDAYVREVIRIHRREVATLAAAATANATTATDTAGLEEP